VPDITSACLPSYLSRVTEPLEAAGYHVHLVGGCVRDLLRGCTPHDFDMTTDATPDEMLEVFRDFHTLSAGIKHGTVTVIVEKQPLEITTHRTDGSYTDSRRPDSVTFTRRLADDLARRDFTVNAMAWSPAGGLVDLFGGQNDLKAGILRAVGEPRRRFGEDALRILRAFRFAAQLDFTIEPETLAGAMDCREGLSKIAKERIFSELSRLLCSKAAGRGMKYLLACECAPFVFGELAPDESALALLEHLPPEAPVRMAALLLPHSPDRVALLCRELRTSNAFSAALVAILKGVREEIPTTPAAARRFVSDHFAGWQDAFALRSAMGQDVDAARALCKGVLKDGTAVELRRLKVSGRELQDALSLPPANTGALLRRLQEAVWEDPAANKKEALIKMARAICKEDEAWMQPLKRK